MRHLFAAPLLLASLFGTADARAEWLFIGRAQQAQGSIYLEAAAADKNSAFGRAWLLHDKQPASLPDDFGSSRSLLQFECARKEVRLLEFHTYRQPMGRGPAVSFSRGGTDWESFDADPILMVAFKFACGTDVPNPSDE